MLQKGDKVGIVCCSNGQSKNYDYLRKEERTQDTHYPEALERQDVQKDYMANVPEDNCNSLAFYGLNCPTDSVEWF